MFANSGCFVFTNNEKLNNTLLNEKPVNTDIENRKKNVLELKKMKT